MSVASLLSTTCSVSMCQLCVNYENWGACKFTVSPKNLLHHGNLKERYVTPAYK